MKEKILGIILVGVAETIFFTACATSGCLFADCIKLKIKEKLIKKALEKQQMENN